MPRRIRLRLALVVGVLCGALFTTVAPARALDGPAVADARVAHGIRHQLVLSGFGANASVLVTNADGAAVFHSGADMPRVPASNEKLVTAFVALKSLGPDWRPVTRVRRVGNVVFLVGAGDPGLTAAQVVALGRETGRQLLAAGLTTAVVRVDDSLFPAPTNAPGWDPTWVPRWVAPVRALQVDSRNVGDAALDAGAYFAQGLVAAGVRPSPVMRAVTPSATVQVTAITGRTLADLTREMVRRSENDYAETLLRLAALGRGHRPTWAGALTNARQVLTTAGIPLAGTNVVDGSGLSPKNRQTNRSLLAVARTAFADPSIRAVLFDPLGLPVAGESGTLENRFRTGPTSCARMRVQAKTGTLSRATNLSGLARGVDGELRWFSILVNGPLNSSASIAAVDRIAAAATGCLR